MLGIMKIVLKHFILSLAVLSSLMVKIKYEEEKKQHVPVLLFCFLHCLTIFVGECRILKWRGVMMSSLLFVLVATGSS